jgi:hypothetical protein
MVPWIPTSTERLEARVKWTADEDIKLKDAVQTHGSKDWNAMSALVPGRTKIQCSGIWKEVLGPNIGGTSRRKGKWTSVEDKKLKDAVQTHGDKEWVAISTLVPGRTEKNSVVIDGRMSWILASTRLMDVRVNGP